MNLARKRLLSFVIVLCNIFFGGAEMVLVLPTLWGYLQHLGVKKEQWLGFIISAYSFAAAIGGLICGGLSDKYPHHAKLIIVICIIFRIWGNFHYMLGLNRWNIFFARLLCGMGNAAGPAFLAELCRTTRVQERRTYLSMCSATYQIGVICGPIFQFILSCIRFNLWGFKINAKNVTGFFLTLLWLFHWITILLAYKNLTEEFRSTEKKCNVRLTEFQRLPSLIISNGYKNESRFKNPTRKYLNEFFNVAFIFLMFIIFNLFLCQVSIETIITVVTEKYFGFSWRENTLIYMFVALEALVSFVGIALIGSRGKDTFLQIFGWFLIFFSLIWLLVVMPKFEEGSTLHMYYFLSGLFILFLGLPILSMASISFSTKILSSETQGLGEGIRRVLTCFGAILGSNWAGTTIDEPNLFLGFLTAMTLLSGLLFVGSYRHLRKAEKNMNRIADT